MSFEYSARIAVGYSKHFERRDRSHPNFARAAAASPAADVLPEATWSLAGPDVGVFRVDHGVDGEAAVHATLTPADFGEFAHIRHAGVRSRSLATRSALRRALSDFTGGEVHWSAWTFERDALGRPAVGPGLPRVDFSCSHTPWTSLIAISRRGQVGIDVEGCQCGYDDALAAGFLSARERRQLRLLPETERARAFARLWTLKEAYLKASGGGLSEDIGMIEFDAISDEAVVEPVFGGQDGLKLAAWEIASSGGRLSAALAIANA